ncbi:uncharacterized protein LOC6560766 [Drosophila grimshawi]|uniref:GH22121 n=1 Tax=Drosophila grimshawi TaxID=7222 RepID=B4J478_DROGR|nr:uncharacterized protein LOC6560766 [Drosophila grimshawi]EDW02684.1 GH22121 [Drosophila grimshawi]
MNNSVIFVINCLLIASSVRAAIEDFMIEVEPEANMVLGEPNNELGWGCPADVDQQPQMSLQDMEYDENVDPQLLLRALMQHAQSLGINLEQLGKYKVQSNLGEDDLFATAPEAGCSPTNSLSYREQPSWYDVFFN